MQMSSWSRCNTERKLAPPQYSRPLYLHAKHWRKSENVRTQVSVAAEHGPWSVCPHILCLCTAAAEWQYCVTRCATKMWKHTLGLCCKKLQKKQLEIRLPQTKAKPTFACAELSFFFFFFWALSFVCVYVCRLRGSQWWHPMSFEEERLAPQHQEHHSLVPGSFL